ncbi:MAG: ATP-dependent RNA helicase HrpA, partial [Desulfobacterales bacterium]|nr:ATP-dependent RNA helicase HrpA [Desulfobacterales bacterium]
MIKNIESLLSKAPRADRIAARRELKRIKRSGKGGEVVEKRLRRLEKRVASSVEKRKVRAANTPRITYMDNLPITEKKEEIIDAIKKNRVVIISGETGSGKTTQIPKFCLAAGRGVDGVIGCTQPRRIAATSVARRIAEEFGEPLGESVGFKIRFKEKMSRDAYIKIMTDGVLLAETQGDPRLNAYDVIIVDEAHERSLNIDFILGILKNLLRERRDLKLIITSATIDTEKFSAAFDDAPVIEVSGRMFPVETRYSPAGEVEDRSHVEMAVQAVETLCKKSPFGDILIFMPTERDIRETRDLLEGRAFKGARVMPLFARLTAGEQARVFSRTAGRKIIVATNVAETSLTIPGIKYVIDSGLARTPRYNPRTRSTSLPVSPIARSSADQREGRCGRVENGICIRLYTEEDYLSRPRFTSPEILRSNLAEVILRMISLKLGDISRFPFIDKPDPKSIRDGFALLTELGAITRPGGKRRGRPHELTKVGRLMARLPIDPRLSRMLIEARKEGRLQEVTVLAAALSIQDPRERPLEKADAADQAHAQFKDPASDFITLLNIWKRYIEARRELKSFNKVKKFCKAHFLSFMRMREWRDIHDQIKAILGE